MRKVKHAHFDGLISKRNNHDGCRRCGGLLVSEQLPEFLLDSGPVEVWGRRYVQCGDVVDPVAQGQYAEQVYAIRRPPSPQWQP